MSTELNYELLKDAVAIIDGIPDEAFDLTAWLNRKGEKLDCGTVACAGGWLSMHPQFKALGLVAPMVSGGGLRYDKDGVVTDGFGALEKVFGLLYRDTVQLFCGRGGFSSLDPTNGPHLSDKELWLARAHNLLRLKGQI